MLNQKKKVELVGDRPWFSEEAGWPQEVSPTLEFPAEPLGHLLRQRAKKTPDLTAIWFLDHQISYRQLDELADRIASAFLTLGIKKGDTLALILPNCFQYVVCYYAAARIGAIVTGVNPTYKPLEVLHQLRLTKARALVYLDALSESLLEPVLSQAKEIEIFIATNIADLLEINFLVKKFAQLIGKIPQGKVFPGSIRFTSLLQTKINRKTLDGITIRPDEVAVYLMTGGTTGVPKAAVITHENCVSNAHQSASWFYQVPPEASILGVIPLFHAFAMTVVMNTSIVLGGWMMLFPKPPATRELLNLILNHCKDRSVIYPGAQILFKRIADFEETQEMGVGKKFICGVSGAGPLHDPVRKKFEEKTGARLVEGYGLSETSPVVSAGPVWGEPTPTFIGLPFPGTDWRIVDLENPTHAKERVHIKSGEKINPEKHVGELAVCGPQVMKEYLGNEEETQSTIVLIEGKKWCLTGDIGCMDQDGRVKILDRKKELIKVSGYSVFPKEVEEHLLHHPSIREVAVAGVRDPKGRERVKAWVVLKPDHPGVLGKDIISWSQENIAHYKVPREVEITEAIPKNAIGKVLRRVLVEKHQQKRSHS